MSSALSGVKIAVLGGDDRELILAAELVTLGATVTVAGFPRERIKHGAFVGRTVEEALRGAEVAVLPMPGTDMAGYIRAVYSDERLQITEKGLQLMEPRALVIIGAARPFFKEMTSRLGISLLEISEMDEVAILNAIPTAEGAVQIAMESLDTTIHASKAAVIGMGRVGSALAHLLKGMGAEVTVFSREPAEMARAFAIGCRKVPLENLGDWVAEYEIIFNTIPALVLDKQVLQRMNPDTIIIDLASAPGGTDFGAANECGVTAILAPGLPGKVAPIMAGRVLAEVVPRLIVEEMTRAGHKLLLA